MEEALLISDQMHLFSDFPPTQLNMIFFIILHPFNSSWIFFYLSLTSHHRFFSIHSPHHTVFRTLRRRCSASGTARARWSEFLAGHPSPVAAYMDFGSTLCHLHNHFVRVAFWHYIAQLPTRQRPKRRPISANYFFNFSFLT